jgi:hypothetical protein
MVTANATTPVLDNRHVSRTRWFMAFLSFPCRVSDEATELRAAISGAAIDSRSDLLGDSERGGLRSAQAVVAKGAVHGGAIRHYVEQILVGDGQSSRAVGENRWLG